MRIVHVINFQFNKSGQSFGNCDHKIHQGLIRSGHYVYPFPANDISRQMGPFNSKILGKKAMNRSLVDTCAKVQPELLILGHGQLLSQTTLHQIKQEKPDLKIAQWYVDSLEKPKKIEFIHQRLRFLDVVFCSTAGPALMQFHQKGCAVAYLPNPVDCNIENLKSFESKDHLYDLTFIGTDKKDPERSAFLRNLSNELSELRVGIFGSLGNPGVYGKDKDKVLAASRASLNLTRYEPQPLYTSDRIAQLMGNGILACVHEDFRLHELYGNESLLTFREPKDLAAKLRATLYDGSWQKTARQGWEVSHQKFSCEKVASAMLDLILNGQESSYPWPNYPAETTAPTL